MDVLIGLFLCLGTLLILSASLGVLRCQIYIPECMPQPKPVPLELVAYY